MKYSSICRNLIAAGLTVSFALASLPAHAQAAVPGFAPPEQLGTALRRLFGEVKAFSAQAEIKQSDKSGKGTSMIMQLGMMEGKFRAEIDLTKIKTAMLPPGMEGSIKQMGLEKVVMLIRPDKQANYMVYPGLKAMVETPMSKEEAEEALKPAEVKKTEVGKETLDGHECVKNKVSVKDADGGTLEALVWNATDLKDFPVQMQFEDKTDKYQIRYKNIKTVAPEAALFEVPADHKKFADMQGIMGVVMQKMLGGGGGFK